MPEHSASIDAFVDAALDCREEGVLREALDRLARHGLIGRCQRCGCDKRTEPVSALFEQFDTATPGELSVTVDVRCTDPERMASTIARAARRTGASRW